jgi:transposase
VFVSTSSDRQSGPAAGEEAHPLDPAPRPSRRAFTSEYKLAIVTEYEQAPNGQKGAILRREGLYSSHIIEWTRARDGGALTGTSNKSDAAARPARKTPEERELDRLRRKNAKLEAELAKTRMALDIVGKGAPRTSETVAA